MTIDDCSGNDNASIGYTTANDSPVTADCTTGSEGLAAVCWDQQTYTNSQLPGGVPGCTYKTNSEATCTGGSNRGFVYACACSGSGSDGGAQSSDAASADQ